MDDFTADLPETDCRYAVIDVEFETDDGRPTSKIVFLSWAPDRRRFVCVSVCVCVCVYGMIDIFFPCASSAINTHTHTHTHRSAPRWCTRGARRRSNGRLWVWGSI